MVILVHAKMPVVICLCALQVDILFEDEKGFWAAIYEIIATTKRPVVMTSNGTAMVHTSHMTSKWYTPHT